MTQELLIPPRESPGASDRLLRLVRRFEACTLPWSQWTHEAHLLVGLWYLEHVPEPEATQRIRIGIRCYNLANGVITTPERGYHETITLFYVRAITACIASAPAGTSLDELA